MRERFTPIDPPAIVFRLATPGSGHLPLHATLPLPDWFVPTRDDEQEAADRGRPEPGLSVWDDALTTAGQARLLTGKPEGRAFRLAIHDCVAVGNRHGRALSVVADPLEGPRADEPGAIGHALIEGLKRPKGGDRQRHQLLLRDLVAVCAPHT